MAKQFLSIDDQPNNAALELLDSDGRANVIPLVLAGNLFTAGTYDGEPLVWNAGLATYAPRQSVVVDTVDAQNLAGPGSALLVLRAQTIINREDNYQIGFLTGPGNHIQTAIVGGATCAQWVTDDATGTPKFRAFDNGTAVVRPTITGSRGGNVALASLLTGLADLGWIIDSTTA
jgi:hypothetical protein